MHMVGGDYPSRRSSCIFQISRIGQGLDPGGIGPLHDSEVQTSQTTKLRNPIHIDGCRPVEDVSMDAFRFRGLDCLSNIRNDDTTTTQ